MICSLHLFGIANCDQVKKAKIWLAQYSLPFQFHDFKKETLTTKVLYDWLQFCNWQDLLNRQGTTWRQLSDSRKTEILDYHSAIALMIELPSLIKRPALFISNHEKQELHLGFTPMLYEKIFYKEFTALS